MSERLSYERFLELEAIMRVAADSGRMATVAAREGLEHVKLSTELGNHEEARLYADGVIASLSDA